MRQREEGYESNRVCLRYPLVVRSIGDRALARQASRLSRPWEARNGEVYAIERRVEVDADGSLTFVSTEIGYWRRGMGGMPDMSVSLFELPGEEMKRVSPFVLLSLEDNRHADLVGQHIKYHHDTREETEDACIGRTYVCLSFWGGMLILEESAFENFRPGDFLLPRLEGGFGFGFIWREISRDAVPDAFHDADILLGKFIADRLYPGLPEPTPPGRGFGAVTQLDDQMLF